MGHRGSAMSMSKAFRERDEISAVGTNAASVLALPARVDVVVVGAGILGLATAVELGRRLPDRRVIVVEKEQAIALHQTGRNSCVVHSGVYYPPGSLKAQLCTAGRLLLREYCEEKEIPYDECGKLIVAADASEVPALDELQRRAEANGVPGLRRLAAEEIREVEPHCVGVAGLHVPTTALVDYRLVAAALAEDLRGLGGDVYTDAGVRTIDRRRRERSRRDFAGYGRGSRGRVVCRSPVRSSRRGERPRRRRPHGHHPVPRRLLRTAARSPKALPCAHLPGA